MSDSKLKQTIALIGNPNSGKSSLFNQLTGLRQSVSNFPGVTVEKKYGVLKLHGGQEVKIIDLPGLYSVFPNSQDEKVVVNILSNPKNEDYPDLVVYVADATQLERHLLLCTQILDLGLPVIFALNMVDLAEKQKQHIDVEGLRSWLGVPVIPVSGRIGTNISVLKDLVEQYALNGAETFVRNKPFYNAEEWNELPLDFPTPYHKKLVCHHEEWLSHLNEVERSTIEDFNEAKGFDNLKSQIEDTMSRYDILMPLVKKVSTKSSQTTKTFTDRVDQIITHKILGPVIFFALMLIMFQSVFSWATYPMDLIEHGFSILGDFVFQSFGEGWVTDLLVNGVLAGLSGVLVFVPQIAILFLFIAILEESGYMSRAVFLFDGLMQKFGLNGRSIVALVSSGACAIPAIMSTRTISSWKERLNTILVAPLISCSARIPVYVVLVGFVVPAGESWGIFNLQGLVFTGLYLLGIIGALVAALFFKYVLNTKSEKSYLMLELPQYKPPIWKNVVFHVKEKVFTFVWEAGKVIFLISIVLWFMASFGPGDAMEKAENAAISKANIEQLSEEDTQNLIASERLETSYAGILGKSVEPVIRPLGFDWKIGIALITSFAAREVFVGTMSTIYAIGSEENDGRLRSKMAAAINPTTGNKVYTRATALALLVFYVFAMQCMSTLAVTKKETNSWKWPAIQFTYMGIMAYSLSFLVYQLMS